MGVVILTLLPEGILVTVVLTGESAAAPTKVYVVAIPVGGVTVTVEVFCSPRSFSVRLRFPEPGSAFGGTFKLTGIGAPLVATLKGTAILTGPNG